MLCAPFGQKGSHINELVSIRMKKNKAIIILIGLCLIAYLSIHAFEFKIQINSPYWSVFVKLGLALFIIIAPLTLNTKWINKIGLSTVMAIMFMFLIPKLGIWNISLNNYVKNQTNKYEEYINLHNVEIDQRIKYLSCRDGELFTKPKIDDELSNKYICESFGKLDVNEVFINKSNSKYLFAMHRFIDNGYGLLYSKENFDRDKFYKERVNGLQITSIKKVNENWYYVTFT